MDDIENDVDFAVDGVLYCIMWSEDEGCDHVLARETPGDQWCSIAQADSSGIHVADEPVPWPVVRELLARQLRRGGFTGIVRLPDGSKERL